MASTSHHCVLRCSFCPSTFGRAEHLHRHTSSQRPFICNLCGRTFKRKDVCKRHWQTCSKRCGNARNLSGPKPDKRGRKRMSCDRCILHKKACNSQLPCITCQSKKQTCSYSRRDHEAANRPDDQEARSTALSSLEDQDFANSMVAASSLTSFGLTPFEDCETSQTDGDLWEHVSTGAHLTPQLQVSELVNMGFDDWDWNMDIQQTFPGPRQIQLTTQIMQGQATDTISSGLLAMVDGHLRVEFLSTFAQETGLTTCFECGSVMHRRQIRDKDASHEDEAAARTSHDIRFQDQFSVLRDTSLLTGVDDYLSGCTRPELRSSTRTLHGSICLTDPLAMRTHEISCLVKQAVCNKPRNSIITTSWSPFLEAMCLQMFSPLAIRRFLALFWTCWYRNSPILHQPSFDLHKAPAELVMVMVLIGASISSEEADRLNARAWFDITEQVVFENELLYTGPMASSGTTEGGISISRDKLGAVQAAFYVCCLQHWEARETCGRRIQKYRHNVLAVAAEDMASSIQNMEQPAINDLDTFKWTEFGLREEVIRIVVYTFLFDTSLVLFHDCVQKMPVYKLNMNFACSQEAFYAKSPEECFAILVAEEQSLSVVRPLQIVETTSTICHESASPIFLAQLSQMSILNSFTILATLNSLLYRLQPHEGYGPHLASIRRGLVNWHQAWSRRDRSELSTSEDADSEGGSEKLLKQCGFMHYAPELWYLAILVLERVESHGITGLGLSCKQLAIQLLNNM
ncbi:hypothetical protein BKA63DRAFT_104296 [Paraphoma chrysanthemicola]|nr:hypothetical protein BKA63DRAFT_104296 [Paraphoma chrysanthemicola]